MKLITRDTDYAVRVLSCIAGSKSGMVTARALAEDLDIPRPFLRKILQILSKNGLLKSYKGKNGGFSLITDPRKITILNLVEIFQGSFQLNEHIFKGKICPNIKSCYFKKKLDGIEKGVVKELEGITIASLLK